MYIACTYTDRVDGQASGGDDWEFVSFWLYSVKGPAVDAVLLLDKYTREIHSAKDLSSADPSYFPSFFFSSPFQQPTTPCTLILKGSKFSLSLAKYLLYYISTLPIDSYLKVKVPFGSFTSLYYARLDALWTF